MVLNPYLGYNVLDIGLGADGESDALWEVQLGGIPS